MEAAMPQHNCRCLVQATRDRIYDLIFALRLAKAPMHLSEANSPSDALLLTSRQIYNEARSIHQIATRSYWQRTTSYVPISIHEDVQQTKASQHRAMATVAALDNAVVEHIRLEVRGQAICSAHIAGKDWYDRELHAWRHELGPEIEVENARERSFCSILVPNKTERLELLEAAGFRADCRSDECLLRFLFRGSELEKIEQARKLGGYAGSPVGLIYSSISVTVCGGPRDGKAQLVQA